MSQDPFEIKKVEGAGGGVSGAGGVSPAYQTQGTAANRSVSDAGAAAPTSTPITDKVNISKDASEDDTVKDANVSSLISALRAPEGVASTQKVNETKGAAETQAIGANYQPGFQAGGAVSQPPGMQTGVVHNPREAAPS
ncbi:MAG: hypothetical protein AB1758_31715 [Candidatus Eremiobacterota bacterium]